MNIVILAIETLTDLETYNSELIYISNHLSSLGHRVNLLIPRETSSSSETPSNITQLGLLNHPVIKLNKSKSSNSSERGLIKKINNAVKQIDLAIGVIRVMKRLSPDILICHGNGILYVNSFLSIWVSKILKIPVLQVWIGSDLLTKAFFMDNFLKKAITNQSINIVQSNHMKQYLQKLSPDTNPIVLPNKGVNTSKFYPKEKNKGKDKYKEKEIIKILYTGRLYPVKGIKYLINAFQEVTKKYPNCQLEIIGEGPESKLIKSKHNQNIILKDSVNHEDIAKFYQNADIFVLSSLSEGLSNSIMEAMACSLPVIATRVGGNKELIDNQTGGFLVPPKNTKKLVEAITKLIDNPKLREEMGQYNHKKVKKYQISHLLEKRAKLMERINDIFFKKYI
mgnify:CR=1 FL=1